MPLKWHIYLFVEQLIYVFNCDVNSYFQYLYYIYLVNSMNLEIITEAVTSL